jgi:hypothetical protein
VHFPSLDCNRLTQLAAFVILLLEASQTARSRAVDVNWSPLSMPGVNRQACTPVSFLLVAVGRLHTNNSVVIYSKQFCLNRFKKHYSQKNI